MGTSGKRFRVAFSSAGEKREFVWRVARRLRAHAVTLYHAACWTRRATLIAGAVYFLGAQKAPEVPTAAHARPARVPLPATCVGDVIDDDTTRAEVVAPTKAGPAGKTTGAWIRREGETVQRAMVWEAWRKVRVVRRVAA
jgi:hypothetical protein